jgi:hypothetical protein
MINEKLNIPKMRIKKIGGFNADGSTDSNWVFDGGYQENSVGLYVDFEKNIELVGGYTVAELREISTLNNKH